MSYRLITDPRTGAPVWARPYESDTEAVAQQREHHRPDPPVEPSSLVHKSRIIIDAKTSERLLAAAGETDDEAIDRHRESHEFVSPLSAARHGLTGNRDRETIIDFEDEETSDATIASSSVRRRSTRFRKPQGYFEWLLTFGAGTGVGAIFIGASQAQPTNQILLGIGAIIAAIAGLPFAAMLVFGPFLYLIGLTMRGAPTTQLSSSTSAAAVSDWLAAEESVAGWMRTHGALDSVATRGTRDGGVDVASSHYVAQVKDWESNVGAPAVRELFGVAQAAGKDALVFAKTGFTADALSFAEGAGVALFTYDTVTGVLVSKSSTASRLLSGGL